jgi:hypothetical protein
MELIATAFGIGSKHDYRLFKESYVGIAQDILCLADTGYLGINKLHANSQIPAKKSKLHQLTSEQKAANRELAGQRIFVEHVIGRLKVFRILSERYRNRRKRFRLRFNLIASLYNLELK